MKKFLPVFLVCLLSAFLEASPFSVSNNNGWYFKFQGSLDIPSRAGFTRSQPTILGQLRSEGRNRYDTSFGMAAGLGYRWGSLRLEGEYSLRNTSFDGFSGRTTLGGIPVAGTFVTGADLTIHNFMMNFLVDLYFTDSVYWYNGLGAGFGFVNFDSPTGDDMQVRFAYQFMTGLGFHLNENVALTLGYRLYTTSNAHFDAGGVNYRVKIPWMHSVEMGLRYQF